MGMAPCLITHKVVSGPSAELKDKNIERSESERRIRMCTAEVNKEIRQKNSREKTPLSVKISGGILFLFALWGLLKYKFKKI